VIPKTLGETMDGQIGRRKTLESTVRLALWILRPNCGRVRQGEVLKIITQGTRNTNELSLAKANKKRGGVW